MKSKIRLSVSQRLRLFCEGINSARATRRVMLAPLFIILCATITNAAMTFSYAPQTSYVTQDAMRAYATDRFAEAKNSATPKTHADHHITAGVWVMHGPLSSQATGNTSAAQAAAAVQTSEIKLSSLMCGRLTSCENSRFVPMFPGVLV